MNELALGVLAQGGRVWVIDVGRSYEKLCGLLGGDFLTFDDENVWDANPLRYLSDESERVERVTAILEEFLGDGEQRAECVEMADAFINAVQSKNPKLIKITWIGLKNTAYSVHGFERNIANIKNVLMEANLI